MKGDNLAHATPPHADSRQHPRHAVTLDITLHSDSHFWVGLSENLSEGGVFLATHVVRRPGTLIELSFSLPDAPEPIAVLAEVRWLRDFRPESDVEPGMGVRFVNLREDDARRIRAFLAHRPPMLFEP